MEFGVRSQYPHTLHLIICKACAHYQDAISCQRPKGATEATTASSAQQSHIADRQRSEFSSPRSTPYSGLRKDKQVSRLPSKAARYGITVRPLWIQISISVGQPNKQNLLEIEMIRISLQSPLSPFLLCDDLASYDGHKLAQTLGYVLCTWVAIMPWGP
ncbi:hypothetical protein EMPG_11437 [Blastomyces silverae]|uniref:Uncharacterized protein n=1 Tax=Blastomyces silverae TaxID=2060906 RepID=A0A0H1BX27_9EURO|nr:hypothetical protein EMPG_11437 [Blastomyces silverae]